MADPRSIDERLDFLLQSTESLHASLQELHATVEALTKSMEKQANQMEKQVKYSKRDRERVRLLLNVVAIHEGRISKLENGTEQE